MQEKTLYPRILKDIPCGAVIVGSGSWKWSEARNFEFQDFEPEDSKFPFVPKLEDITVDEMTYWLSRFALEVKKRDGTNYRHEVLYSLFCGLNRVIKEK
jgi:hypothetical protein